MDIIKFRAWNKNEKRMFVPEVFCNDINGNTVAVGEYNDYNDLCFEKCPEPTILMAHTGLSDKNKVGVYAGDIYDIGICTKIIRPDHFIEDTYELMKMLDDGAVVEVIGNIYANPELLEFK